MRMVRVAVLLGAVLMLAACAGNPEIPFDRAASTPPVKTIGLLTPSFPDHAKVSLASTVGQSFGMIGALIDAGLAASRASKFNSLLQERQFSGVDRFTAAITADLQAEGYTVVPITIPRNADRLEFATKYPPQQDTHVDAYLDVVTTEYGYVAAGIGKSTPYRPLLWTRVRLVSAKDGSVLMQDSVIYNPINIPRSAVTIAPDPEMAFADFDTLMGDPDRLLKGLQIAAEQSAQGVGNLVR